MNHIITRFWVLCLVPLVVPMCFLPIWVNLCLALCGALAFSRRIS